MLTTAYAIHPMAPAQWAARRSGGPRRHRHLRLTQRGLGLVELLIASAIGLFLLAGLTDFLGRSLTQSGRNFQDARLTQDLNVAMELMTRDLRRAGYSSAAAAASTATAAADNPFTQGIVSANDGGINIATSGCVLYSYDFAPVPPGEAGKRDANERLGFRLRGGAVEAGIDVNNCDPTATAGWQQLTDPRLTRVTGLSFEYVNADGNVTGLPIASPPAPGANWVVCMRLIRVTLTGQLLNTPAVTRTLTQTVRVRNDWYRTGTTTCS
jgi:prepilin peptidase dependent protein B